MHRCVYTLASTDVFIYSVGYSLFARFFYYFSKHSSTHRFRGADKVVLVGECSVALLVHVVRFDVGDAARRTATPHLLPGDVIGAG